MTSLPDDRGPPPSESNAFARRLRRGKPPANATLRFVVGVVLSLLLAAFLTIALVLLGALVVRGVRHGDYRALAAAVAVVAMTVVMARGRRKK